MWCKDRSNSYHVEHIKPRSKNPADETNYLNLTYACGRCNDFKGTDLIINPRLEALGRHIRLANEGMLEGISEEGWVLIEQLHLNEWPALANRRNAIDIYLNWLENGHSAVAHRLYLEKFGFPENLPDLEPLMPPLGNSISSSERNSYFRMRTEGRLPAVY